MTKFKVGDEVRRVAGHHLGMMIGDTDTVASVHEAGGIRLAKFGGNNPYCLHDPAMLELVQQGPVRTVTRKEIVPGGYDGVRVDIYDDTRVRIGMQHTIMGVDYLRSTAALFTQLADALEDQK